MSGKRSGGLRQRLDIREFGPAMGLDPDTTPILYRRCHYTAGRPARAVPLSRTTQEKHMGNNGRNTWSS